MTLVRLLIIGCVCAAAGCSGNGEVEARPIPVDRPGGFTAEGGPGGSKTSKASDSTELDTPVE